MSVVTGRDGYVNGVPCLTSWGVSEAVSAERFAASCSGYGTIVSKGNKNYTGQMSGVGDPPNSIYPGNEIAFKGVSVFGTPTSLVYDGTILINQLQINCPIEQGGPLTWQANFGVQGALTEGTTGAQDAAATVSPYGTAGDSAGVKLITAAAFVADVRSWQLTINAPEKTYVTAGLTYRKPGNVEADISFDVYNSTLLVPMFAANAVEVVELYTAAATKWVLSNVMFTGKTNYNVNRRTQDLIGYTVTGMWHGVAPEVASKVGYIKRPNGTYVIGTGA